MDQHNDVFDAMDNHMMSRDLLIYGCAAHTSREMNMVLEAFRDM
jgi:hypothetical protein